MSIVKTFLAWFHEDCANPMEEYFNHLEARIEAIEEKLRIIRVAPEPPVVEQGVVQPEPAPAAEVPQNTQGPEPAAEYATTAPTPAGDADAQNAGENEAGNNQVDPQATPSNPPGTGG